MNGFDIPLAIVAAVGVILAFTEFFVRGVRQFRGDEYETQKRLDHELMRGEPTSAVSLAFEDAKAWVLPLHRHSAEKQNAYYDCLTRQVSSLALAVLILIVGLTVFAGNHWFSTFSATVEALAFLYVLHQFSVGKRANKAWVNARIQSEIVRQAGMMMAAGAAAAGRVALDEEEKARWEKVARAAFAQASVQAGADLAEDLDRVLIENRNLLSGYVARLTPEAFDLYLAERARRQLRWFTTSISRLHGNHKRREGLLRLVFIGCAITAVAKFGLSLPLFHAPPVAKSWILVFLFIGAAWASAYTAFYLSNNQRSLFHRYNTQVRQIREWLRHCDKVKTNQPFSAPDAQAQILWFEALMAGELVDWVRITLHDSMELSA